MRPELALAEAVLRLLLVLVLAGAVGVERELRDQMPACGHTCSSASAPRCS